jgi:hypothetical protein
MLINRFCMPIYLLVRDIPLAIDITVANPNSVVRYRRLEISQFLLGFGGSLCPSYYTKICKSVMREASIRKFPRSDQNGTLANAWLRRKATHSRAKLSCDTRVLACLRKN